MSFVLLTGISLTRAILIAISSAINTEVFYVNRKLYFLLMFRSVSCLRIPIPTNSSCFDASVTMCMESLCCDTLFMVSWRTICVDSVFEISRVRSVSKRILANFHVGLV